MPQILLLHRIILPVTYLICRRVERCKTPLSFIYRLYLQNQPSVWPQSFFTAVIFGTNFMIVLFREVIMVLLPASSQTGAVASGNVALIFFFFDRLRDEIEPRHCKSCVFARWHHLLSVGFSFWTQIAFLTFSNESIVAVTLLKLVKCVQTRKKTENMKV